MRFKRICLIVLDSVGIGELPDASLFGDQGAHTLGHIASTVPHFRLPHMQKLGLGCIEPLLGIEAVSDPVAYYGKMAEISQGKDTMTGHWELMGVQVKTAFQVFPNGFPKELIEQFEKMTGRPVIGNVAASGTEIIQRFAEEQHRNGAWIVYTSADSVFQIAAHEEVISLSELYRACEIARQLTLQEPYAVGRVIARPFIGSQGNYTRTANRHDYAVKPPAQTALLMMQKAGLDVIAIGKIHDIYAGEGITEHVHTASNLEGIEQTIKFMSRSFQGICFCNLVDFDSLYGHRRDPLGYGQALMAFDRHLPSLLKQISDEDLLVITADHGNDPTYSGTDHTREYVPLLVYNPRFIQTNSLGTRSTFADVSATILDNFTLPPLQLGQSFLSVLQ